ncbi:MAG: right-handed parallel beta-helix repeat-containing protein [Deltaproteobacteria bacterium]|nr:right-handed parallel beta-helix repeat-containing protein [Deltaproteobacteria bacterium]
MRVAVKPLSLLGIVLVLQACQGDGPVEENIATYDAASRDSAVPDAGAPDALVIDGRGADAVFADAAGPDAPLADAFVADARPGDVDAATSVDAASEVDAESVDASSCVDDCALDQRACAEGGVIACGQHDGDECLEWSAPTPCGQAQECEDGQCVDLAPPAKILINEVVYDARGEDTADGNNLFLELWGAPGQSLDGHEIVGIDGNGGREYVRLALDGKAIGPDGYYLIVHAKGDQDLRSKADQEWDKDFENGPDSIQLRWKGRIVDALGYGRFEASHVFAGEKRAATGTSSGRSLTRNVDHLDTDNNYDDFKFAATPTPRGAGECTSECARVGATDCEGSQVKTCGNYDTDACLEWSAPQACPGESEECRGGKCEATCTSECTAGVTDCDGAQVKTCGNYDGDACLEWGTAQDCPSGEACIARRCQVAIPPSVRLAEPRGTVTTTHGQKHRLLASPIANGGRSIAEVRFYADDSLISTDAASPFEASYEVPLTTPNGAKIALVAKAIDSAGLEGVSEAATLDVQNSPPVAEFGLSIASLGVVSVDASASSDAESPVELCWDWDNNGTCDTEWGTARTTTHDYAGTGMFTVRLKVKDNIGQISETTRDVFFVDTQHVGPGSSGTTTWYGTIIVGGDIVVEQGQVLTIAEGTQVLFLYSDAEAPAGRGDYGISVKGSVVARGTAERPIVFSSFAPDARRPGGWDRITLQGSSPSSLSYVKVEHADLGIEIRDGSSLSHVDVTGAAMHCVIVEASIGPGLSHVSATQCGGDGLAINRSRNATISRFYAAGNGGGGITARYSVFSLIDSTVEENKSHGILVSDSKANITYSRIERNQGAGIWVEGSEGILAKNNLVTANGDAGVSLWSTRSSPRSSIEYSNIFENAMTGTTMGRVIRGGLNLKARADYQAPRVGPSIYTAPDGETIRRVFVFADARTRASDRSSAAWITDTTRPAQPRSLYRIEPMSDGAKSEYQSWVVFPEGVTQVEVGAQVAQVGTNYYGEASITVTAVELTRKDPEGRFELASHADEETTIATSNFWTPVITEVPSKIYKNRDGAVNFSGASACEYPCGLVPSVGPRSE